MIGDGFGGRLWYNPYNYTVGSYSAYTICGDSDQLYGWGSNTLGQLGTGNRVSSSLPLKAVGMTNVLFYSTGYNMAAIQKDFSGWVWGSGLSLIPEKVLNNVKFADASATYISFVKNDGSVWSVGSNAYGVFGNDTFSKTITKIPQKALNINMAVRVAAGRYNLIILTSDGKVYSTGSNQFGGLGNGANFKSKAWQPVLIPGLKNILDIKANTSNIIALDSAGDVYSWGRGSYHCIRRRYESQFAN